MDKEVLPPSDRASRDGVVFAPGFRASGPSVTRVRIPVRPQQRVCYAFWNNKGSSPVAATVSTDERQLLRRRQGGCFGLNQRVVLPIAPWKERKLEAEANDSPCRDEARARRLPARAAGRMETKRRH